MPLGTLEQKLSGFTSDHTYVSAIFLTYDANGNEIILKGFTWNLLDQCNGKPENNFFEIVESAEEYVARKVKQLDFLKAQMKSGIFDFIALQEVDIFTQNPMPEFVKKFLDEMRKDGWQTTHTEQADNVLAPLLTFYNTAKLEFVAKKPVFPMDGSQKNCGLEATFKYANTDQLVCITNIQLDDKTDFRETILRNQKRKIVDGVFEIIAGDASHKLLKPIENYSLIGDMVNHPTTFKQQGVLICSDGFMAGPAASNQYVVITEGPLLAFFQWVPTNLLSRLIASNSDKNNDKPLGKYVCVVSRLGPNERLPHGSHVSLIGEPWIAPPHKYLLTVVNAASPKPTATHPEHP